MALKAKSSLTPQTGQKTPTVTTGSGAMNSYVSTVAGGTGAIAPFATKAPTFMEEVLQPDINTTRYIANLVHQNLTGMDATEQEIQQIHKQFTDYAAKNPVFTRTTTYQTDPNTGYQMPVRDIQAGKSGLTESDFITNIIRKGPQAQAYKAATTYMDAMKEAMGAFGGGF
jgi:hypothetical protein